ncbi:hypothetical protein [Novilysobacter ciconiae]|uniref:hypothetical protein n=1 Tax=Novilysobacter ciconiae TaxID=2781022 RepID=UPI001D1655FD|nr:hypothetical protein [Lysobacter ciconiae]
MLIGVEGPDDTLKLPLAADALLADLADIAREQGFEDLTGMTRRVLAKLRREPAQGRSLMHRGRQVTLGAYDAQLAIAASLATGGWSRTCAKPTRKPGGSSRSWIDCS